MVLDPQTKGRIKFRLIGSEYLGTGIAKVISDELWDSIPADVLAEVAEILEVWLWLQGNWFDVRINETWMPRPYIAYSDPRIPIYAHKFSMQVWNRNLSNTYGYSWGIRYITRPRTEF